VFPFGVLLTLKTRAGGRLVLSPSILYRAGFAVLLLLTLFLSLFGIMFEGEATPLLPQNAAPLLFFLASLVAVFYNDSWIFDRDRGTLENRFGLLPLYRSMRFDLGTLRRVGIESFRKGRLGAGAREGGSEMEHRRGLFTHIDRLVAWDAEDNAHVLDTARGTHRAALERTGRRIAEFCGVPYTE
jgi:hypothetical protein